jgi:hypothetical protein
MNKKTGRNNRAEKYDPKLKLKEGVEWRDLIDLTLQPEKKKVIKKPAKKKK